MAEYTGTFYASELATAFRLKVGDGGELEWTFTRRDPIKLQPLMQGAFTGRNLALITFKRDRTGKVTALTISAGRVRRLAATKVDDAALTAVRMDPTHSDGLADARN